MPLTRAALALALLCVTAPALRAEYIVLRTGQKIAVTSYELDGDKYRLQTKGGLILIAAADVIGIEPEDTFAPVPQKMVVQAPYREVVEAASKNYGVDADLITSVIAVESNFDPKAVSRKNARGLMQLLPETASRFGVKDIFDPQENVNAGTRYLRELLLKYNNDLALTLAAYNAGSERVEQYGHNVPPYSETVKYVSRVKTTYEKSKKNPAQSPLVGPGLQSLFDSPPAQTAAPQSSPPAQPATQTPKPQAPLAQTP